MVKTIELYTDKKGYELFLAGKSFIATSEQKEDDYKVIAPIENVTEYPLEDELESYDIVNLTDVKVYKIENSL
ncbi:hypothetical protein ABD91_26045 [Lysinibacillus sphaericus]|uniref:hypothetical protein n=1 Tax=Lysinibacillus sphaericus TaxID=1421 RepID=UPI0018CF66BB|nr:hypothetical protein [Lysinibacillus sphaericus]MBG9694195.1 hypothetical protein [Lysinibacillus sphaericus]